MKKFWIHKWGNNDGGRELYEFFMDNPEGSNMTRVEAFWEEDFESLTGLKLKPGEIVQCELKVIKKG